MSFAINLDGEHQAWTEEVQHVRADRVLSPKP